VPAAGILITAAGAALLAAGAGALLGVLNKRWPRNDAPLVDAIDACLPQIQCAQCGYPGCRPYAVAVAGGAPIDRCPPGGSQVVQALAQLLGRSATAVASDLPVYVDGVAVIDEQRCIGCALCLPVCPVDAIVGAHQYLHTVVAVECTGCELCLPACPVDCITIAPRPR
jgi:electron transport complex protein RnfB